MAAEYGEYTRLVIAAQADTDPARRQLAMNALAIIGPMAGGTGADGHCPGDTLAAPVLARLYPPDPQPAAASPAAGQIAAIIARAEQEALDAVRALASGSQPA